VNWRPVLPRRKRLPRTISRTEASDLISAQVPNLARVGGDNAVFRTVVRLMGVTGMRVGELRKLSVADITPDGSVIRIPGKSAQYRRKLSGQSARN
jgi:integrase